MSIIPDLNLILHTERTHDWKSKPLNQESHFMQIFFLFFALLFASAPPAHAYLDPGTGSLLLQGMIAAAASVMVSLTLCWNHCRNTIRRLLSRKPPVNKGKD